MVSEGVDTALLAGSGVLHAKLSGYGCGRLGVRFGWEVSEGGVAADGIAIAVGSDGDESA